jgi:hypothetical protein
MINRTISSNPKFKKYIYGASKSKFLTSKEVTADDINNVSLLGCNSTKDTENDLLVEATTTENVLFYSLDASFPFIDSLYRNGNKYIGIQVTVGNSHSFSLKNMEEYSKRAKALNGEFQLYYLVLETKLDKFRLDLSNELEKDKNEIWAKGEYKEWKIYIVGITGPSNPN